MNAREALKITRDYPHCDDAKQARRIMDALAEVWTARRAVIEQPTPIESAGPAWVAWRTEQARLALELSTAEARLIALEDGRDA